MKAVAVLVIILPLVFMHVGRRVELELEEVNGNVGLLYFKFHRLLLKRPQQGQQIYSDSWFTMKMTVITLGVICGGDNSK